MNTAIPIGAQQTPANRLLMWAGRLLGLAALAVFVAAALPSLRLFAANAQTAIPFPYPLNYGEGPLLDQTLRLAAGENIYRPNLYEPPYTISNYPPLYMLAQLPFVQAHGASFAYGRVISLAAALAAAALLGLTVWTLAQDWMGGLAAGVTLLCIPYIMQWAPLNRIDSLALALSWAGIFVAARWGKHGWAVVVSALLLAGAAYTRQTYLLAAPLAVVVWLWARGMRLRAVALALLVANAVMIAFCVLLAATGGGFFTHVITANTNAIDRERINFYVNEVVNNMPVFLALCGVYLVSGLRWRGGAWWLALPYLLGGVVVGLTIGKIGSDVNYLYELAAALCLVAGGLLGALRKLPALKAAVMLALAWQVGALLPPLQTHYSEALAIKTIPDRVQQMEALSEMIETAQRPIADEFIGLLPLAGRRIEFQPFEFTQLVNDGAWDESAFVAALANGTYDIVMVYQPMAQPSLYLERWTQAMRDALNNHYRPLRRVGETTVYRAREP